MGESIEYTNCTNECIMIINLWSLLGLSTLRQAAHSILGIKTCVFNQGTVYNSQFYIS